VPFSPRGGHKRTGDAIGWFIVAAFLLVAIVGTPGSPFFVVLLLCLSVLVACVLRFWHGSEKFP